MSSKKNRTLTVFLIAALPFVFFGLIDPLEGGLSLLIAGAIYATGFSIAKQKPQKYLTIPFALTLIVGVLALVLAIAKWPMESEPGGPPPLIILLWTYRALAVATLVGAVLSVWKQFSIGKESTV